MTLKELEAIPREYLTAAEIAPILGSDQQEIRMQARECPEMLGFPVICIRNRVKIPKIAFLKFMRGELPTQIIVKQ